MIFSGGCLCGALRYESNHKPLETGYCHCTICRKSTSAPLVAFASFPIESFLYTNGTPSIYQSSSTGSREFCGKCGTQICHREIDTPVTVDVNSGTLDDISLVPPEFHIYTKDSVPWLEVNDELPRYSKGSG
jgi:hypothetical protein